MKTPPQAPAARRACNRFATLAILVTVPSVVVLGWRALIVLAGVIVVSVLCDKALREPRFNLRHWPIHLPVEAILLAGLLPARLAGGSSGDGFAHQLWPLIPFAAILLSLLRRLRDRMPVPAFDPVVVVALIVLLVGGSAVDPRASLQRDALVSGDLVTAQAYATTIEPWYERPIVRGESAVVAPWAARNLQDYLHGKTAGANLDSLIRDRLPPLEDLVLLGHPMPIGMTSGVMVLAVILWGSYRRTINYRIPLIAIACAYIALLLLPTPTSFGDRGASWRLFPALQADVGPATALTFAHYLLFASPTLFCVGLLSTRGDVRPLQPIAVLVWSVALGVMSAVSILYGSVILGPLFVLLFAPAIGRWLDRVLVRKPLSLPAD